jgi:hypothetical protein
LPGLGLGFRFSDFVRLLSCEFRISGFGFRFSAFGIWFSVFGVRDSDFGIRISILGCRVSGFGIPGFEVRGETREDESGFVIRDSGFGFRFRNSGFRIRVSGCEVQVSGFGVRSETREDESEVGGVAKAAPARQLSRQIVNFRVSAHLTQCINSMILESQLPHKSVNALLTFTNSNKKLTVLCGS